MTNQEHLARLMNSLNVGEFLISAEDIKTVDFSEAGKVTVETFDGFVAEESDAWHVAQIKERLGWKD